MKIISLLLLFSSLSAYAGFVIPNNAVTTAKIANGAVTVAKRADTNSVTGTVAYGVTMLDGTYYATTGVLTVTGGKPVLVNLKSWWALVVGYSNDLSYKLCYISVIARIFRGTTLVSTSDFYSIMFTYNYIGNISEDIHVPPITFLDSPGAGNVQYQIKVSSTNKCSTGSYSGSTGVINSENPLTLQAIEM